MSSIQYRRKGDVLSLFIGFAAFAAGLQRYMTGDFLWAGAYILTGFAAALRLLQLRLLRHRQIMAYLTIITLLTASGFISGGEDYRKVIFILAVIGSAIPVGFLLVVRNEVCRSSGLSLIVISIIIAQVLFEYGLVPSAYNDIFSNASRNRVGAYLVILAATTIIGCKYERGYVPIWPSTLALLLSVPLYGRASIILSCALLLISLIARFKERLYFLLLVPCAAVMAWYVSQYWHWFALNTNLSKGAESPRIAIIREYIERMGAKEFFFGVDMSQVKAIADLSSNPHNSFILLHSLFGITPFVLMALAICVKPRLLTISVSLACLVVMMMRAAVDTVAFGDYLDHAIFASILLHVYLTRAQTFKSMVIQRSGQS